MTNSQLSDVAYFVRDTVRSDSISLEDYVTTDSLLQNKEGRTVAENLPPQVASLIAYKKGDVLIANIRPYLRKIWFADSDGGASHDVLVLRAKDGISSEYLYSLLLQDDFFSHVMKAAKGAKMPRGDEGHIMRFPVVPLDEKDQRKIGKFLSSIDRLIQLSRKRIENLEKLAKEIYDYWFVQFDFPDEHGKPYKSSGGKMAYNAQLKREIPAGWEVKRVVDVAKICTGKEDANFAVDDGQFPFFTCSQKTLQCAHNAFSGSAVLIAGNGDFNVKRYIGEFNAYQRTYVIIPNNVLLWGAIFYEASRTIDLFKTRSSGSIIKFITLGDVCDVRVVVPSVMDLYKPIADLLSLVEQQKKLFGMLTQLREFLLPLLMNGQAKMGGVE